MPKAQHPPVALTDAKVRSLRSDPVGEYTQGDTQLPGFGVRVRPTGAPVFVMLKRAPGDVKPTRITIGRVGDLALGEARQKAREAAAALRQGVDVNTEKRREAALRKADRERVRHPEIAGYPAGSFGAMAQAYIASECAGLARGAEIEALIRRRLLPNWGDRPLTDLRRADLTALLDPIVAVGQVQAAHKVREVAIRVVNWVIDRGDLDINFLASPSRGRRRTGILRRTRRDRVLSEDEIRAIWQAGDVLPPAFAALLRLLLLTGQRRDEVAGMEWRELDLDLGIWTIPAERYKTRSPHAVPLPPAAVAIIKSLPRVCDRFVLSTAAGTHVRGFSKTKARVDDLSGVTGWRLHDLRRTVRTGLAGLRVDPDIAERVIGHVVGGVRGVYDRHLYLDEKRDALDRWGAHLAGIVAPQPARVVRLRTS